MIRALFAAALLLTGCADGTIPAPSPSHPASPAAQPGASATGHATTAAVMPAEHHDHEHGATYACPMHPDVVSDKPGQCPKCGMNLVMQPGASATGHPKD